MKREDLPVYWFDTSTASKICLSVEGLGFVASSKNIAFSMGTKADCFAEEDNLSKSNKTSYKL